MEREWYVNLTSGDPVTSSHSSSESIPSPPGFIERELSHVSCIGKAALMFWYSRCVAVIGGG